MSGDDMFVLYLVYFRDANVSYAVLAPVYYSPGPDMTYKGLNEPTKMRLRMRVARTSYVPDR